MSTKITFPCESCSHKKRNDDPSLHCYMFKDRPTADGDCMQHTGRPKPSKALVEINMATAVMSIMTDSSINFTPSV